MWWQQLLIQYTFTNVRSLSHDARTIAMRVATWEVHAPGTAAVQNGGCGGRPTGQTTYRHRPLIIAAIADS